MGDRNPTGSAAPMDTQNARRVGFPNIPFFFPVLLLTIGIGSTESTTVSRLANTFQASCFSHLINMCERTPLGILCFVPDTRHGPNAPRLGIFVYLCLGFFSLCPVFVCFFDGTLGEVGFVISCKTWPGPCT